MTDQRGVIIAAVRPEHLRPGEKQVQRPWGASGQRGGGLARARFVPCEGGNDREGGGGHILQGCSGHAWGAV